MVAIIFLSTLLDTVKNKISYSKMFKFFRLYSQSIAMLKKILFDTLKNNYIFIYKYNFDILFKKNITFNSGE